jgi:hypothetical protein
MSNKRKLRNNDIQTDTFKAELTKASPAKPPASKSTSVSAPVKSAPVQVAQVTSSNNPAAGKAAGVPAPVKTTPVQAAPATTSASPAARTTPAAVSPAPKPDSANPSAAKLGHVSLELVKPGAKHVFVAGSFNGWKPEKTPLIQKSNGRWVGDLDVNPGRHEYLFVVDGQWLPDPNAKESVQNPFGGRNSILTVSA